MKENIITFFSKLQDYYIIHDKEIPENIVFHVPINVYNTIPIKEPKYYPPIVGMRLKLFGFNCKIV